MTRFLNVASSQLFSVLHPLTFVTVMMHAFYMRITVILYCVNEYKLSKRQVILLKSLNC